MHKCYNSKKWRYKHVFLGIDIGTSGVKAVIVDEHGVVVDQQNAALAVSRPHPLWSEQDPDDYWTATQTAVLGIDPAFRARVQGIGIAGQMHGATLLGADDRPLRPVILWNDGRSFAECTALELAVSNSRQLTGNIAMPGFTAPKLLWVREHEPEIFAQTRTILLPKDYVRLCLTGDKASDLSDSAGTLWLDVVKRDWSDAMLEACDLSRGQMPLLHEGCRVTGKLRSDIAASWGMDAVPVAAGGGVGQRVARVGLPLSGQQRVKINRLCSHGEGHLVNRVHCGLLKQSRARRMQHRAKPHMAGAQVIVLGLARAWPVAHAVVRRA